ncbi:MAG: ankyrin repeat domain-containing protein [Desulfobacterales bacterium]|nr:ankyrin repeat domain-containing protein [Desulfobacterales bacterium]
MENGADVNVQDESWMETGRTPLMYAVIQGDAALVQAFLAKGARLDLKNKDGDTALSLAKKDGLDYITQLLEKPAGSGSSQPPDPSTHPLFKAIKEGALTQVKSSGRQRHGCKSSDVDRQHAINVCSRRQSAGHCPVFAPFRRRRKRQKRTQQHSAYLCSHQRT